MSSNQMNWNSFKGNTEETSERRGGVEIEINTQSKGETSYSESIKIKHRPPPPPPPHKPSPHASFPTPPFWNKLICASTL